MSIDLTWVDLRLAMNVVAHFGISLGTHGRQTSLGEYFDCLKQVIVKKIVLYLT
jgi:hypothetical protein